MSEQGHYEGAPGAKQDPETSAELVNFSQFEAELAERANQYATMLPSTLPKERFINMAIAAIKQNPDLLKTTKRSLFSAITAAALDGIPPDGKHGVIAAYNTKVKRKKPGTNAWEEVWENQAKWNPMAQGMRKRARELDGILVDAQVVCANDEFFQEQGDEPKIVHRPAPLNKEPGPIIGAYAIFKREDGTILHREVMNKAMIDATREQSSAKGSLMWTTFQTEGCKKTVVRRGFKSVPVSDDMAGIIQRDDERNFEFDEAETKQITPPPAPPPAPLQIEDKQQVPMPTPPAAPDRVPAKVSGRGGRKKKDMSAEEPKVATPPEPEAPAAAADGSLPGDWDAYLDRQFEEWDGLPPALAEGVSSAVEDNVQAALERGEINREQSEAIMEKWQEKIA